VAQNFPHHRWQRRACQVAPRDEAAALGLGRGLRHRVRPDLGAVDGKLEMKMGENVLDAAGHLQPLGLERGMVAHGVSVRRSFLPGR